MGLARTADNRLRQGVRGHLPRDVALRRVRLLHESLRNAVLPASIFLFPFTSAAALPLRAAASEEAAIADLHNNRRVR